VSKLFPATTLPSVLTTAPDDTFRQDDPKPKKRRPRRTASVLPNGDLVLTFDRSAQIERGPGYTKFETCQLVWDTVAVEAGHSRIKFPTPFESTASEVIARWRNPDPAILFITYDATLLGFRVFSEGPRLISYVAVGA
jgi:hypothetical protein